MRYGGLEGWASARFLTPTAASGAGQPAATQPARPTVAASAAPASAAPAPAAVAASGSGALLAATALRYLGAPYLWGGSTPAGWDCSGLVAYVYHQVTGRSLPRSTQEQWGIGTPIAREAIQAGITHVGFALGDGRFVHASAPGVGTIISSLADPFYVAHYAGARRL